jgi:hypothetical protein
VRPIAIATCKHLPEPDVDEARLLEALRQAGVDATMAAWDEPAIDWSKFGAVVIRSTWNYIQYLPEFLAWADRVEASTRLYNPASIVRWNSHKSYLRNLEADGIPIVPTAWLDRGAVTTLVQIMDRGGWDEVVIKPQVGAGSFLTDRFTREDPRGEAFLRQLVAERQTMVQPYLRAVEGYGERSLIFIDGELTHAIRKSPRLGDAAESVSEAMPIAEDERALATRVLAPWASQLLYGRVDLIRGDDGAPRVMELELVEPSLFLRQSPAALARLVGAIDACARAS